MIIHMHGVGISFGVTFLCVDTLAIHLAEMCFNSMHGTQWWPLLNCGTFVVNIAGILRFRLV